MTSTSRQSAIVAMLVVGAGLFFVMYHYADRFSPRLIGQKQYAIDEDAWIQRIVLTAAAVLTLVPAIRKAIGATFEFLRRRSTRTRRWTALLIFLLSGPLLYGLGAARGRLMLPIWHDENMYRMQTTFLAHGKFCLPGLPMPSPGFPQPDAQTAHRLADFFDSPYISVHDVYAPVYFPGTAILHVPAAMAGLPYWLTPLVIASISLTLLYLIVTELIDGLAGVIAVVLMISLMTFRWLALVEMSHAAGMMWGLSGIWCWLAWRRSGGIRWVILVGVSAGFYAITRPLDAICVLTPVALAWLLDLRSLTRRKAVMTLLIVAISAAPLVVLQLAFDRAITGHVLEAPLECYNRVYLNAKSFGLQHWDPEFRPPTPVPQIQTLYDQYHAPFVRLFTQPWEIADQWFTYRVPLTLGSAMPTLFLVILLPVALLGLQDRRQWIFWSVSWCYLIGAGFFYVFVPQYTIAAAPAIIFAVVLGISVIQRAWPTMSISSVFVPLAVLALAIEFIAINQQNFFEPIPTEGPSSPGWVSRYNYRVIPDRVQKPAIVFFHFDPKQHAWEEPVYNWDVLNPDDAPIIRVHDLGPGRNLELLRYYAQRQPDRQVYWFDRRDLKLSKLGNVAEAIAATAESIDPASRQH